VPLDPLQERIARTALALPEARTLALAGGGAMIAHGFVTRETKDIDLFTEIDDAEAIRVAAALRRALHEQHLTTRDGDRPPFEHRFVAVDAATGRECTVEVFADGGRLRGVVGLDVGPVLHPDDLAADKTLALWARARPATSSTSKPCSTATAQTGSSNSPRPRTAVSPSPPSSTRCAPSLAWDPPTGPRTASTPTPHNG
jgi:hypothetical protein